jgi:hypothetical protein
MIARIGRRDFEPIERAAARERKESGDNTPR